MNLTDQLLKLLAAGSLPQSPEITALLGAIKQQEPQNEALARSIVDNWPVAKPSFLSSLSWGQMGAVGGGVGVAALLPFLRDLLPYLQSKILLPSVTDPLMLLPIIAALGALAGAGYSIYCNHGFVAPTFEKRANLLVLGRAGILNEIAAGAVAAVTTVWLAAAGLALPGGEPATAPPPEEASSVAPPTGPASGTNVNVADPAAGKKNLLNWSIMISAVTSGWFGARMRSSKLDQSLLQTALAEAAARPAAPKELADLIREAPSAAMAAHLATGKDIAGVNPSVLQGAPANDLWILLNEMRVRAAATPPAKLTNEGRLLTLGMLQMMDSVNPLVSEIIKDFSLPEIAGLTKDDFLARTAQAGLKPAGLEKLLEAIRSDAVKAVESLKRLPPEWSWPG